MIESRLVLDGFSPLEWVLMLEDLESLPSASKMCRKVHGIKRRIGQTQAVFDVVWKSTPQISLGAEQTYSAHTDADGCQGFRVTTTVIGMPFRYGRGTWLLRSVPGKPRTTDVHFRFEWEFQSLLLALVGNAVLKHLLVEKDLVRSVHRYMQRAFDKDE